MLALDWPAVAECATWIGVDVRIPRVLSGLQALERVELEEQAKQRKAQQSEK